MCHRTWFRMTNRLRSTRKTRMRRETSLCWNPWDFTIQVNAAQLLNWRSLLCTAHTDIVKVDLRTRFVRWTRITRSLRTRLSNWRSNLVTCTNNNSSRQKIPNQRTMPTKTILFCSRWKLCKKTSNTSKTTRTNCKSKCSWKIINSNQIKILQQRTNRSRTINRMSRKKFTTKLICNWNVIKILTIKSYLSPRMRMIMK